MPQQEAFQSNAFQNNAFQCGIVPPIVPPSPIGEFIGTLILFGILTRKPKTQWEVKKNLMVPEEE